MNTTPERFKTRKILFFSILVFRAIEIPWTSTRENLSSGVCEQQRRISACASAQHDQRLCYLGIGKYHIWTCYERNFNLIAISVVGQSGLNLTLSETRKTGLVASGPK